MKIKDSLFTIAGLLFGRGSLINPGQNCIVLYFFNDENDFIKEAKIILSEYEPIVKKIQLNNINSDVSIMGMYIVARHGKTIKDIFKIDKSNIIDRKIPKSIIEADQDGIAKFIAGLFSVNCDIKKEGYIFFRYPTIALKEIGCEAIFHIKNMLERIGIESEIENNSEKRYSIRGEEKIVPSILTIKRDQAKIFAQKIALVNPDKKAKLEKITSSF